MKKLLLTTTFLSISAQATTFVPIDYDASFVLGDSQYIGTTKTAEITILAKQTGSISISMIDTAMEISDESALDAAESLLSSILPWPDGYEAGLLANYPALPENPDRFSHIGVDSELTEQDFHRFVESLLVRIKATMRGTNYIYEKIPGYTSRGVSGDHVLITDHYRTGSGNLYYCDLNVWDFDNSFEDNMETCMSVGSAQYYTTLSGGINVGGYSDPHNSSGTFLIKRGVVQEKNGAYEQVNDLILLRPGLAPLAFAVNDVASGSGNSNLMITSGSPIYIGYKTKTGSSYIYQLVGDQMIELNGNVSDFSDAYSPVDGEILEYVDNTVLFRNSEGTYSCQGYEWSFSEDVDFDSYLTRWIEGSSEQMSGLFSAYPNKPDNYEDLIVELGVQEYFQSGISDEEFAEVLRSNLEVEYQYLVGAGFRNIVCINDSVRHISETNIVAPIEGFEGLPFLKTVNLGEEISSLGANPRSVIQILMNDHGSEISSVSEKMLSSLYASGYSYYVDYYIDLIGSMNPGMMENYPAAPSTGDLSVLTDVEFRALIANMILGSEFYNQNSFEDLSIIVPKSSVSISDEGLKSLHFNRGKFMLSTGSSASVKVKAVPDRTVVDPYLNPYLNVSIDIEGAAYAGDIQCSVNNSALTITSSEYGSWGGGNPLRLPLISNANNIRGVVTHTGTSEPDAGGTFMQSSLYADMTTATVAVECTAELSAANGQVIPVVIENASITLDDGIHGGEGGVSGVIVLPPGVNAEDVTVSVTINGRTVTLSPNTDGSFTYPGLRDGDYIVSFQADQYVQGCTNATVAGGIISIGSVTLHAGDINGDGEINIADFTFLSGRYGSVTGDELYDARADLNKDGLINVQDLAILAGHFGSTQCVVN